LTQQRLPWIDDRIGSYFVDAQLIPLFIQENYLSGKPSMRDAPPGTRQDVWSMEAYSEAADCIANGDLISELMYRTQVPIALPTHAEILFDNCIGGGACLSRTMD
jgi:hypothetical protein